MSGTIQDIALRDVPLLAALHAACFHPADKWSATSLTSTLEQAETMALKSVDQAEEIVGFILGRVVADQAEILTLAVSPPCRRQNIGAALVTELMQQAITRGASRVFLEVADDNVPAQALYTALGFSGVGFRSGYYPSGAGAKLLARDLP